MDSEANASSAQGCDDDLARGTVPSLPRLHAANIEKNKEKMKFKNRRKVLRISTPTAPTQTARIMMKMIRIMPHLP